MVNIEIEDVKTSKELGKVDKNPWRKHGLISCPNCGKKHWVSLSHMKRENYTGRCSDCRLLPEDCARISKTLKDKHLEGYWKGKHLPDEVIQKLVEAHKGIKASPEVNLKRSLKLKGIQKTPEVREHIAQGVKDAWKNKEYYDNHVLPIWNNPEEKTKRIKAMNKGLHQLPTRPELELGNILYDNYPNEYLYNGDGELLIVDDLKPDYIHVFNKHVILEHGDYHHRNDDLSITINRYKKHGYACLILWEHEILYDTELTIRKIKEFRAYINVQISANIPSINSTECLV